MSRWETHRGDEWWYSDYWCSATAAANQAGPSICIESVTARAGQLTKERFHSLLWLTRAQFPEAKLLCSLTPATLPFLEALAQSGRLAWSSVGGPYSREAQIASLLPA